MSSEQNERAKYFRSLHVPGKPLIIANCYDGGTAAALCANPKAKAIATASYAIATVLGTTDETLTFEENLRGIEPIAKIVKSNPRDGQIVPLTCDIQGGYDDRLEEIIKKIIDLGAVGCNLEDVDTHGKLYPFDEAVDRVKRALAAAREAGVPDFVVNARSDAIGYDDDIGGGLENAIARAKKFLEVGAPNTFLWGGIKEGGVMRGTRDWEVEKFTKELGGKVNVIMEMHENKLTYPEIAKIGVARISIGPQLHFAAMAAFSKAADEMLDGKTVIV